MKGIEKIRISKLKFDKDINHLVPEMTEKEFDYLLENIEEQGQHTPIHINWDNTVLDGRHRVKALQHLEIAEVSAIRENLEKDDALKFVRDTAVERRSLTDQQRLNVILTTDDLVNDFKERAKENRRNAMKKATKNNPNHKEGNRFGSCEPKRSKEVYESKKVDTNKEIADVAGVSKSTVTRAKKVRAENPEGYQKAVNGESTFYKEYYDLPSIKNKEHQKRQENKRPKLESTLSDEEIDLMAEASTMVKRLSDLAYCIESSKDISKVIDKAFESKNSELKEAYYEVEKLFSQIGLKIETNGGTK